MSALFRQEVIDKQGCSLLGRTQKGRVQLRAKRLPLLRQSEAAECGLACLAMIAGYYGHDFDLVSLRRKFPVSMHGVTLETLINISAELSLTGRALRLDLEELKELATPCIIHWDLNHFVVLKAVSRRTITIHDPAFGVRKFTLKTVSDHFTGIALELSPTARFKPTSQSQPLKLTSLIDKGPYHKPALLKLVFCSLALQLVVLAMPFYLQLVVDRAITNTDFHFLWGLAAGFAGLTLLSAATQYMRSWIILTYGHQLSFQMTTKMFRHLLYLPISYFEKRHMGDVISRLGSTEPIQKALTQSVVAASLDGVMAIITAIVIFAYSPILGGIVMASVAILLLGTAVMYPHLRRQQEAAIMAAATKNSHMIESLRAMTTIKLFSFEPRRMSAWRNLFTDTINANLAYGKSQITLTAIRGVITGLQVIAVICIGATLVMNSEHIFTVGMLFAFMGYRQNFTNSMESLLEKWIEFRLLGLHMARLADIAQSPLESPQMASPAPSIDFSGPAKIELRGVSFRYSPHDPWVLRGVNMTIEAGEFVALSGHSGSGKSTLLKIMLGLYVPTEGQIVINNTALDVDNRAAWRRHIGVVMQDDQLLTGSLADNISFFDLNPDMARIKASAITAQIHEGITAMPMGYMSLVGDMGSVLSGGQKQRILLARALYRRPQTLFLDEGTANIDEHTEKQIVDIISKTPMTRLIVAHRTEFIRRAERVIYLKDGQIMRAPEAKKRAS